MTKSLKSVYADIRMTAIANATDRGDKDGHAWISSQTLTRVIVDDGYGLKGAKRLIGEMEELGLIRLHKALPLADDSTMALYILPDVPMEVKGSIFDLVGENPDARMCRWRSKATAERHDSEGRALRRWLFLRRLGDGTTLGHRRRRAPGFAPGCAGREHPSSI